MNVKSILPDDYAKRLKSEPIAIVAVSGIFPDSANVAAFWDNIVRGRDMMREIPKSYWLKEDFFDADPRAYEKTYSCRAGVIPAVPFDFMEFGIPPMGIPHTDSLQLLGLLIAKSVLQEVGRGEVKNVDVERTSCIFGFSLATTLTTEITGSQHKPIWMRAMREAGLGEEAIQKICDRRSVYAADWTENTFPGILQNVIAGRIANRFDLHGTNCTIDAACASSLASIYLAMRELWLEDCDLAIAGGAQSVSNPLAFFCFSKTPALSPNGVCRPFDTGADGTMLGEGLGCIALKRLRDAERDGDGIYAVIKGIGASSDGKGKSIYAPEASGQVRAFRRTYADAGYSPDTVDLLEGHGTGTPAGDDAELKSSEQVFAESGRAGTAWCALGSLKSQTGHTAGAAGIASTIKTVMALHHKVLPPTIHADSPAKRLLSETSPFYLNTESRPWIHTAAHPRRASVSSFGFGGSNLHMTLEEYRGSNTRPLRKDTFDCEVFVWGGENHQELATHINKATDLLDTGHALFGIAQAAATAFCKTSPCRATIVATSKIELRERLQRLLSHLHNTPDKDLWLPPHGTYFNPHFQANKIAFLFPGQGSQRLHMGADVTMTFDCARKTWDRADAVPLHNDTRLSDVVFPRTAFSDNQLRAQTERITQTEWAQPALGVTSAAMLAWVRELGITPDMTAGHSFGELTALYGAGVFDLKQLVLTARQRGELMAAASSEPGGMLAVKADAKTLREPLEKLGSSLSVANENSPSETVLSGGVDEVERLQPLLREQGFLSTRLSTSTAFHSPYVAGAADQFRNYLNSVAMQAPSIPVYSNVTAGKHDHDEESIKNTLATQLTNPVRFVEQLRAMYSDGANVFIEIGSGAVLTRLVGQCLGDHEHLAVSTDNKARSGMVSMQHAVAQLVAAGVNVELAQLFARNIETIDEPKPTASTIYLTTATHKKKYPVEETETAQTESNAMAAHDTKTPVASPNQGKQTVNVNISTPIYSMAPPPTFDAPNENDATNTKPTVPSIDATTVIAPLPPFALGADTKRLTQLMLEVVADKTGYPIEMLQLDMTMEADLGIDSIKRVEILSAIREQEPDLPEFEVERLAELQTLQQIVEFMVESHHESYTATIPAPSAQTVHAPSMTPAVSVPAAKPSPVDLVIPPSAPLLSRNNPPARPADVARLTTLMLEVVADKTGYPADMLQLDMTMEADLGIDSIKRVEILSAIREREPALPEFEVERLAELQTLQEIVDFMAESPATKQETAPGAEAIKVTLSPPATPPAHGANTERLTQLMLEVVAEKTGYPADMLQLDMTMEADLGIDSTKRVEILSAIREHESDLPEFDVEGLAELQTLQQIVDFMGQTHPEEPVISLVVPTTPPEPQTLPVAPTGIPKNPQVGTSQTTNTPPTQSTSSLCSIIESPGNPSAAYTTLAWPSALGRYEVCLTRHTNTDPVNLAHESKLLIIGDPMGTGTALARLFRGQGLPVTQVNDTPEPDTHTQCGAVVDLRPLARPQDMASGLELNRHMFQTARGLSSPVRAAAQRGGGWYITVQDSGGDFGSSQDSAYGSLVAGAAALAKTLHQEWPDVYVKAIDLSTNNRTPNVIAQDIFHEILRGGDHVEIALTPDGDRRTQTMQAAVPGNIDVDPRQTINQDTVLVVTGGARGVTAACIIALAKTCRPKIALLGRTDISTPETDSTIKARTETELKSVLYTAAQAAGQKLRPAELQTQAKRILNAREVRDTIAALQQAGSPVMYAAVDVQGAHLTRSSGANECWTTQGSLRTVVEDIRKQWGPITGLIHGAGVLADRKIEEKSDAQFNAVLGTKVQGAFELLSLLEDDPINVICFFSSIAARFGNIGQCDYAMANDILNKLGHAEFNRRHKRCVVKSFNWGAWAGGMVTPELQAALTQRGTSTIAIEDGTTAFVHELLSGRETVEVVVAPVNDAPLLREKKKRNNERAVRLHIDAQSAPAFADHVVRHAVVLPFVAAINYFIEQAQSLFRGYKVVRCLNVRMLKGITLDGFYGSGDSITVAFDEPNHEGDRLSVTAHIISDDDRPRYSCSLKMSKQLDAGASVILPVPAVLTPYVVTGGSLYHALFHGPQFQFLDRITSFADDTMTATLKTTTLGNRLEGLATDLAMHEGGLQLAGLWVHESTSNSALPVSMDSLQIYRTPNTPAPIQAVLTARVIDAHRTRCDIAFHANGQLLAEMIGLEAMALGWGYGQGTDS